MSTKYYAEGEMIKKIMDDIEYLPIKYSIKDKYLRMPKEEYDSFVEMTKQPLKNLSTVLFETVIDDTSEETKCEKVSEACNNMIATLEKNYKKDLCDNFYEEKLHLYENFFVIYIRDDLCSHYRKYKEALMTVPQKYWELDEESNIFSFPEYEEKLDLYISIRNSFKYNFDQFGSKYIFSKEAREYLIHSNELLLKDVSELFKLEFSTYLKNELLEEQTNRIRKLIYLLKDTLKK